MDIAPGTLPRLRPRTAQAPLGGLLVVDFSRHLPGPLCSLSLAQLGAAVLRVQQPPDGDPARGMPPLDDAGRSYASAALERGSVTWLVDLADPAAREAVLAACDAADVTVESFRPGVAARLGIDAETLRARNRRLVCCSLSGYGQDGPWAQVPGHDANFAAQSGLLARGGSADGPALSALPTADVSGGLFAATAICAALVRAQATGEGCHIDLALAEAVLAAQAHQAGDTTTLAGRGLLQGDLACYAPYRCADGRHVVVCALEPKFFARACELLELPDELRARQFDPGEQDEIRSALADRFASAPAVYWHDLLSTEDTCVSMVLLPGEVAGHPQLVARGALEPLPSTPPVPGPASPWVIDGARARADSFASTGGGDEGET